MLVVHVSVTTCLQFNLANIQNYYLPVHVHFITYLQLLHPVLYMYICVTVAVCKWLPAAYMDAWI